MKICKICGCSFNEVHFNEIRKWKVNFCSKKCSGTHNMKLRKSFIKKGEIKICQCCKKEFYVAAYRKNKAKFCSRSCLAKIHLPQFKKFGFKPLNKPYHKYKTIIINGKQVREHRYIMELHVGRKLTQFEHIHHINGNSLDNRIENLVILTNSEHGRISFYERKQYLSQSHV